jgi:hypothetical protein
MSTNDRDSNQKLIGIIKLSENLSSLFQDIATKTRPETMSLELLITITPIRSTPLSVKTVISEFAKTGSEMRLKR